MIVGVNGHDCVINDNNGMITNMTQCINNLLKDFIMADQLIPRREMQFQLYEVLNTQSLCEKPRFEEHNVETFNAVIDMAEKNG